MRFFFKKIIMNKKYLPFTLPLLILGTILMLMGLGWIFSSEPWMLDKFANEQRLNMKFDKLFEAEINSTLPGYLKQIYRFFGLWVFIIGLFISSFSRKQLIENKNLRLTLLSCISILVYFGMFMAYWLIPTSPFIFLGWLAVILHSISLFVHFKILN